MKKPIKLLIVDDHVLFREGLVSLLKSHPGFDVVGEAGSVRQAVEMAHQLQPEQILMDFLLPDGTGLDATKIILKHLPDCKIVFLTVHEDDDRLFAAIRCGAKGYLLKNVPIGKLVIALRSLEQGEAAISRTMTARILNAFSSSRSATGESGSTIDLLTPRELDVLRELAKGCTNREIGDRLYITENTVKNHVHNILRKLEFNNRRQASDFALRQGLG